MTHSPPKPDLPVPSYIPPDPIVLPADKDKLGRWLGDGQALLARLQETYGWLHLMVHTMPGVPNEKTEFLTPRMQLVGQLIREAVEHFQELPHED